MKRSVLLSLSALLIFITNQVHADVNKPYTFTSGTPASAAQVNANFDVLYAAVNQGGGIPTGAIIMWSGDSSSLPTGWALCDGSQGTPDLQGRFIVGTGNGYSSGNTGGTATNNLAHNHTVNSHNHSISGQSPGTNSTGSHSHHIEHDLYSQIGDTTDGADDGSKDVGSESHGHRLVIDTWAAGAHSHTVNSHNHGGTTGNNAPVTNSKLSASQENRPPYYALAFIMKL